ncbi:hypothetical protein ACVWZA_002863 [Sphingomonas sp. UYAg733]
MIQQPFALMGGGLLCPGAEGGKFDDDEDVSKITKRPPLLAKRRPFSNAIGVQKATPSEATTPEDVMLRSLPGPSMMNVSLLVST